MQLNGVVTHGVIIIAKFFWKVGSPLPSISAHSDAKLRLIETYLTRYFPAILVRKAQDRQRITLVDGFCGGGRFDDQGRTVSGTPFLFLEAVEKAENEANLGRTKPFTIDAEFHFVDSVKEHIDHLQDELRRRGYGAKIGKSIFLYHSNFEEIAPDICRRIEARTRGFVGRSIFLLDQKGYTDVAFQTARKILRFSAAECILTFAVGWLIDYLNDTPQVVKRVAPIEISEDQIKDFLRVRGELGGRYVIQRLLLRHIKAATGALFQSPFFLRSQEARKDLWLVHLSNHLKARNVMVDSHWLINNQSLHQGHGGLEILGFDPKLDPTNAPNFWFGENDASMMRERLAEDFLRRLHEHNGADVHYGKFVSSLANETPARLSDIDGVTSFLVSEREFDLKNSGMALKRTPNPVYKDSISVSRQPQFWSFSK